MKIGFFDSGLGGLTILRAAIKELPDYDYVYYGDTLHLPYGDKTEAEIFTLSKAGIEYLFERGCVLVVVACNTASAETLRNLQDSWLLEQYPGRKVLGVIVPTIETVLESQLTDIALLATTRTVESDKYNIELRNRSDQMVTLTQIAAPELVPVIELNELDAATQAAIDRIESQAGECTGVILGCTHYTQITEQLRLHFGEEKYIFSQDEIIPQKLFSYLQNHPEIERQLSRTGERSIHLTQHRPDYDVIMGQFLGGVFLAEE